MVKQECRPLCLSTPDVPQNEDVYGLGVGPTASKVRVAKPHKFARSKIRECPLPCLVRQNRIFDHEGH